MAFRSRRMRRRLGKRDGWKCRYCGKKLNFETATIDHVIPQSKGGASDPENLVLACRRCNGEKADSVDYGRKPAYHPNYLPIPRRGF